MPFCHKGQQQELDLSENMSFCQLQTCSQKPGKVIFHFFCNSCHMCTRFVQVFGKWTVIKNQQESAMTSEGLIYCFQ